MKFYFVKAPSLIKLLFSKWTWSLSNKEKIIYLTFDDGPTPEVTDWTLNELNKYNAKATFFCIGKNIEANKTLFKQIYKEGHAIGNHTHNHLSGWKTNTTEYINNCLTTEYTIKTLGNIPLKLFRPPYGKITFNQSYKLRKKGYKIIMWDVLSADFDIKITPQKCLENVIMNTTSGSILVFHDSIKASENLKFVLPKILDYYSSKNYRFEKIPS